MCACLKAVADRHTQQQQQQQQIGNCCQLVFRENVLVSCLTKGVQVAEACGSRDYGEMFMPDAYAYHYTTEDNELLSYSHCTKYSYHVLTFRNFSVVDKGRSESSNFQHLINRSIHKTANKNKLNAKSHLL